MWPSLVICCFILEFQVLKVRSGENDVGVGEPLFLTPLLEEDRVSEAQQLSKVKPDIGNTTSYSGYFTVEAVCDSNIFFWFFPAQKNWSEAPVLLYLQGGPGVSSMYSLFEDLGPLTYKENRLGRREYSWNVENNIVFIDQPVGTGYSFTGKGCFASDGTTVGKELYSSVVQFFQLFPELKNNKCFIVGGSYAGHFIPQLGYTIHKNNPSAKVKVNLSGMLIGDGWMDALYQMDFGNHLYQLGLIDDEGKRVYDELFDNMSENIYQQEWHAANDAVSDIYWKLFPSYVGNISMYNYLTYESKPSSSFVSFVQQADVRRAIHVGNRTFTFESDQVVYSLSTDDVTSVKPLLEELLEHYVIVFYNGQLDLICAYPMMVEFLRSLEWSGAHQYQNATRHHWCVGDQQAGYFKGDHHLYDVLFRKAGHSVIQEQPLWAYTLLTSFTSAPTDNPLHALDSCSLKRT